MRATAPRLAPATHRMQGRLRIGYTLDALWRVRLAVAIAGSVVTGAEVKYSTDRYAGGRRRNVEPERRIELRTCCLQDSCSAN